MQQLVLLSQSPRRRDLLKNAGYDISIDPSDAAEPAPKPGESPDTYCLRMAQAKWSPSDRDHAPPRLASDTVVALGQNILGKPSDMGEAESMLRRLSNQTHQVYTAIVLGTNAQRYTRGVAVSDVRFARLTDADLQVLLDDRPCEYAGAYAIQGAAGAYTELLKGDRDTVIGLPLTLVRQLLAKLEAIDD